MGFVHQWVGKPDAELVMGPLEFEPEKIVVNQDKGVLGIFKEVPRGAEAAARAGQ
jgi:hypothetical protein